MVSNATVDELRNLDEEIGKKWYYHQEKANTTDELLHFLIADGIFDAKFDGLVHAADLSIKHFVKYIQNPNTGMDVSNVTQWTGGNPAIQYGRAQADFHWEIDTRMWQYYHLLTAMRRSFRDAIRQSNMITGEDESELLQLNNEFWEEVIVQYLYRTEIIERARGFSEHPNKTAGSDRYGYEYETTWNRDSWSEYTIDGLNLNIDENLIKKDHEMRGEPFPSENTHAPEPFPSVKKNNNSNIERAVKKWLSSAKHEELADNYLRVVMGSDENKRWIPTRYSGWKKSIEEISFPYLKMYTSNTDQNHEKFQEFNLNDAAVRFGISQSEFQCRLKGSHDQLIGYLKSQQKGIEYLSKISSDIDISVENIDSFFDTVCETIGTVFDQSIRFDDEDLSDVADSRPVHPRFAPHDPMEPLPWNTDDPEKHKQFMEVRGFTI